LWQSQDVVRFANEKFARQSAENKLESMVPLPPTESETRDIVDFDLESWWDQPSPFSTGLQEDDWEAFV
jgi:hypothetical protein